MDLPVGTGLTDEQLLPAKSLEIPRLIGTHCVIERLTEDNIDLAHKLYENIKDHPHLWTYLKEDAPRNSTELQSYIKSWQESGLFYFILKDNDVVGSFCYLRIRPSCKSVEIGNVLYSSKLQKTTAATEAQYLMMSHAFRSISPKQLTKPKSNLSRRTCNYRRYEWKCDSLNSGSRNASIRLGFKFEGTFRQDIIYKGRNRDTDWLSILDCEFEGVEKRIMNWLDPKNFDTNGKQLSKLNSEF